MAECAESAQSGVYGTTVPATTLPRMVYEFSDEAIEQLRVIVEDEFQEPVTLDEARVMANDLLALYELLSASVAKMDEADRAALGLPVESAR